MNALHAQDIIVLLLALSLLSKYADGELSKSRKQNNNAKQAAMLNMRQQIANVRSKLQAMQVQS